LRDRHDVVLESKKRLNKTVYFSVYLYNHISFQDPILSVASVVQIHKFVCSLRVIADCGNFEGMRFQWCPMREASYGIS